MKPTPTASKKDHLAHDDARVVMSRPMVVTAGGSLSHAPIQAARLVMAGNPRPLLEGLPGYTPIVIKLDWPDMGVPEMESADWKWLASRIRALKRPLHVSCAMGHGRTGTCLALLAHFWGQIPRGADPVAWVRAVYCPDAVETPEQIRYLERMTGRVSKCKAKEPILGSVYTGGGYGTEYGADWSKPKYSDRPSTYFPENDASRALATGKYQALIRYCGQTTKGVLCPKPARDGQTLCDLHYYERIPLCVVCDGANGIGEDGHPCDTCKPQPPVPDGA